MNRGAEFLHRFGVTTEPLRRLRYEWMEHYVQVSESGWNELIEWYQSDQNEEKSYEWIGFAARRYDLNPAEAQLK